MITIPKPKTPENIRRRTRLMQKIAGTIIVVSLFAYPISLHLANSIAPETMSTNFLGDKSDPVSSMVGFFGSIAIALSILILGIANRINYHYAASNDPSVSSGERISATVLVSIGWIALSLVSILLVGIIFFMMRLSL